MESIMTKEECKQKIKEYMLLEMLSKRNPEKYKKLLTERKKVEEELKKIKFEELQNKKENNIGGKRK